MTRFARIALCFALLALSGCLPPIRGKRPFLVILTWQDTAHRAAILIEDLDVEVKIHPMLSVPYSSNGSAAIWVGVQFPFEKARDVIEISRKYYADLRYIALSDYRLENVPESVHRELFIGGETKAALDLNLQAWDEKHFQKLRTVKTAKEFYQLVCQKYPKGARLENTVCAMK